MEMGMYMLLSATEATGTAADYTRMFGLDLQLLFDAGLTLLAVITLFFFVGYFLLNPVRAFMKNRQDKIAGDISTAENEKNEAVKMKEEYEAKLKDADKEVERILSDARARATANETKIISEARNEAQSIIERANKEAELEKKRVMDEVKQEMVTIASMMAGKVVAANIDTTIQDSLIDETLKEIGDATWQS